MIDKVRVLQTLAKASGLLDQDKTSDKPAVVEVKMVGPKMDEDEEFAKRFALKPIKPDERLYQVRYLRPELVKKLKEFLKKEKRYGKRKKI